MDRLQLCDSLLLWLQTFGVNSEICTPEFVSDGITMSKVLNQIAPEYFSTYWLSKIKSEDVSNWRLKVSNLKKILTIVMDYFAEILGYNIPDTHLPDVNKIGESCDKIELSRMLQLILICAVNCQQKQEYIRRIMALEESVQHMVMTAIQELLNKEPVVVPDGECELSEQLRKLTEQLRNTSLEKDELIQRCHDLDLQVASLHEMNAHLTSENTKLLTSLEKSGNLDDATTPAGRRLQQQKIQIESLQEEVYRLETAKEDIRIKADVIEKEKNEQQTRITELSQLAEQANMLKDEVDILRHMTEKVERYEATIDSYKRKIDELSDYETQVKILEEKFTTLLQEKIELEEEFKKSKPSKEQLYSYKTQIIELQSKLDDQNKLVESLTLDSQAARQNVTLLKTEKDRLLNERDSLKELNEELQCTNFTQTVGGSGDDISTTSPEMLGVPLPIRQKIIKLEHEIKTMRPEVEASRDAQNTVDFLKLKLDEEQKKEQGKTKDIESLQDKMNTIEVDKVVLEKRLIERDDEIRQLEAKLQQNRNDMILAEERYKKYLEKAKSIIQSLDPQLSRTVAPDFNLLRTQLMEKDKQIQHLEKECEVTKEQREQERKLMVTAWYNMGTRIHRKDVEDRLSNSTAGQSFLSRQRQAHKRRTLPSTPQT